MSGAQNSTMPNMFNPEWFKVRPVAEYEKPELINLPLHLDDRGSLYVAADRMDELGIKRVYLVHNFKEGMTRAWHGHKKATTYMHVVRGSVKLCCMSMEDSTVVVKFIGDARKPQMLKIPGGWYNGAMSLSDDTLIMVMSTLSFDEVKGDDFRRTLTDKDVNLIWKVKNR